MFGDITLSLLCFILFVLLSANCDFAEGPTLVFRLTIKAQQQQQTVDMLFIECRPMGALAKIDSQLES